MVGVDALEVFVQLLRISECRLLELGFRVRRSVKQDNKGVVGRQGMLFIVWVRLSKSRIGAAEGGDVFLIRP